MIGRLQRFLSRHVDAVTMERLVDPILADIRVEEATAERRGRKWTGRWIQAAGVIALLEALALEGWRRFWAFREWPDDDRRAVARSMIYAVIVTAAGVKLLLLPPLLEYPLSRYQELALYLVPQAFPVALPIGLLLGLLYGFRSSIPSLRSRTLVTVVAIACSISSFAALAWVVPASNQAFRVAARRDSTIPRGFNELTLGELRSRVDADALAGLAYHSRVALAASPVVLTAWALVLIPRLPARRRWLLGIVAIASCAAYYSLVSAGRTGVWHQTIPPVAGAWLPNAAFLAALVLLIRRTSHDERRTAAVTR